MNPTARRRHQGFSFGLTGCDVRIGAASGSAPACVDMTDTDRLTRLEERYTHLQQHVTEQDKVVLALTGDIDRLRREVAGFRDQLAAIPRPDEPAEDEQPPHY
ncbi:MAG TPA: SlyX family protein [Opitutaceae bacterium]